MSSLQIRDIPDHILKSLKEQAKREHRSLTQQALYILIKGLNLPLNINDKRKQKLDLLKRSSSRIKGYKLSDPVRLIREDRVR
jgi:plasmid stability protein